MSVPTAARIAAAELGPSAGPASSLRRSSLGRAGLRNRAGRAAPPVRVPGATPGLPTDCELRRTGRSTDRFSTDRPPRRPRAEDPDQDRLPPDDSTLRGRSVRPFIPPRLSPRPPSSSCGKLRETRRYPVPTPRSSLFIAPPHFHLLREASRKGALPISSTSLL